MECPKCEIEMEEDTTFYDAWDYAHDRHITPEVPIWVCPKCDYYCEREDDHEVEE